MIAMGRKGLLSDDDFKEEMNDLRTRTAKAQIETQSTLGEEFDMDKVVTEVFAMVADLPTLWEDATFAEKQKLRGLIFTKNPPYDGIKFGTPQVSLILANRTPATRMKTWRPNH